MNEPENNFEVRGLLHEAKLREEQLEQEIVNIMGYIRVHRNDVPADVRESMDKIEQYLDARPPQSHV